MGAMAFPLQLSAGDRDYTVSGDWDGHDKSLILWSLNYFCVNFYICFESLSCTTIQPRSSFSLARKVIF